MPFEFTHFPTLTTQRLILREVRPSDSDAALMLWGDPEVRKFITDTDIPDGDALTIKQHISPILNWCMNVFATQTGIRWGITLKGGDDTLIGTCGFHAYDNGNQHAEVGYDLAKAHWRKGIITEAMQAVIRFCFVDLGVHRVEADVTAGNIASLATLHKLGFQLEGRWRERALINGQYHDLWLFGLLRREWEARQVP